MNETVGRVNRSVAPRTLRSARPGAPFKFASISTLDGSKHDSGMRVSCQKKGAGNEVEHGKILVDMRYIYGCMAPKSECFNEECNKPSATLTVRKLGSSPRSAELSYDPNRWLKRYPKYRFIFNYAPLAYLVANGKASLPVPRMICNLGCVSVEDAFFFMMVMSKLGKGPKRKTILSPAKKAFYLELKERRKRCPGCRPHGKQGSSRRA